MLLSPKLSVADVECPYCGSHLHAGRQSKRIIWSGLILGGLAAGLGGYGAFQILGWSKTLSMGIIIIIAITISAILTTWSWFRNDFYI